MKAHRYRKRTPHELAERALELEARGIGAQDFAMAIDHDGLWYHQGRRIERLRLVRLFASILTRLDDGTYWLITPTEWGRIDVADAPFIITGADIDGADSDGGDSDGADSDGAGRGRRITLYTNLGEAVPLDAAHPLVMRKPPGGGSHETRPYVMLDGTLEARISRSVFYDLAEAAEVEDGRFVLWSHGTGFDLGRADEGDE